MRVAVLGAGSMGRLHAELLVQADGVSDLLVADLDADRARAAAEHAGGRATSLDDALATAEAVVIVTPPEAHRPALLAALERGIPAFCEKPLSATLADTIDLAQRVESSGAVVQVGFQRRFDPGLARMQEMASGGQLGELALLRLAAHDPIGPAWTTATAPSDEVAPLFRDSSIHDFDMARWLTGQEAVEVHAEATGRSDPAPRLLNELETAVVTIRLSGGTLAVLDATLLNPRGYDIRAELIGSRDAVATGLGARLPLRVVDADAAVGDPWPSYLDRFRDAYRAELDAFLALARGEGPNRCSVRDGLEAMRLAVAASRSYLERRRVRLEEIPTSAA
ncbi:MAG TPA: Gfo/Idh/MocA family oxidoreductase [Candidatus Limnocylindrales bacterium]|nr:Gfo/Idh/MocA family oxidoreductase [Candidatus Limnocylindrales bacterium]